MDCRYNSGCGLGICICFKKCFEKWQFHIISESYLPSFRYNFGGVTDVCPPPLTCYNDAQSKRVAYLVYTVF